MFNRLSSVLLIAAAVFFTQTAWAGLERGSLTVTNNVQGIEVNVKTQLLCDATDNYYVFADNARRWEGDLHENPIQYNSGSPVTATWANCLMADSTFFKDYNDQNSKQLPLHSTITVTLVDLLDGSKRQAYLFPVDRLGSSMDVDFFGRKLRIAQTHTAKYAKGPFHSIAQGWIYTPAVHATSTALSIDERF